MSRIPKLNTHQEQLFQFPTGDEEPQKVDSVLEAQRYDAGLQTLTHLMKEGLDRIDAHKATYPDRIATQASKYSPDLSEQLRFRLAKEAQKAKCQALEIRADEHLKNAAKDYAFFTGQKLPPLKIANNKISTESIKKEEARISAEHFIDEFSAVRSLYSPLFGQDATARNNKVRLGTDRLTRPSNTQIRIALQLQPQLYAPVSVGPEGSYTNRKERAELLMLAISDLSARSGLGGFDIAANANRHNAKIWARYKSGVPLIVRRASNKRERLLEEAKVAFWHASGYAAMRSCGIQPPHTINAYARQDWEKFYVYYGEAPNQKRREKFLQQLLETVKLFEPAQLPFDDSIQNEKEKI